MSARRQPAVPESQLEMARQILAEIKEEDAAGGDINYPGQAGRLQAMLEMLLEGLGGKA